MNQVKFSETELDLIAQAKKKSAEVKLRRIGLVGAMIVGVGLMVAGAIDADKTAYLLVVTVLIALGLPQFGDGPKYEDLVSLLDKKAGASGETAR